MAKKKTSKKKQSDFFSAIKGALKNGKPQIVMSEDYKRPKVINFKHIGLNIISGGLIRGKISEIVGPSRSGKSFLAYEIMGQAIKEGGAAYLYDTERAFEAAYGAVAGIPAVTDRFLVDDSTTVIEDMQFNIADFLRAARAELKNDEPIVVCVDSYFGARCKEQYEKNEKGNEAGYGHMKKANAWYELQDTLIPILDETNANLILINPQTTDTSVLFGDQTSSRAKQTEFRVTQRFWAKLVGMENEEIEKGMKVKTEQKVKWEMRKNRFVTAFKYVTLTYSFKEGLRKGSGLGDLLVREKLVRRKITKDPNDGRKKIKGFVVLADENEEFYPASEAKRMLEEHPHLLEPQYVDVKNVKDEDYEVETEEQPEEAVIQ